MPTPRLSPELIDVRVKALEDALKKGFSPPGRYREGRGQAIKEAARVLKMNSRTIESAVRDGMLVPNWDLFVPITDDAPKTVRNPPPPTSAASEPVTASERVEIVRLRDNVTRLQAQLRDADRGAVSEEEIRKEIFGLSERTPEPPNWLLRVPTDTGVTGIPCAIWSDWHLGEVVNPEEMNGINAFNLEIADTRIRRLVERTLDLCFRHMTNPNYPGIIINLLGDIVSGMLHPELERSDEMEVFPMILWAVDRLIWALDTLSQHFPFVFVPCVPGNHGRVFDRKPRAKSYAYRNADWLVYNLLERHFKTVGNAKVQFSISATGEVLYQAAGHRYMAVHGDMLGVKGGDGIIGSIGPIMRGEIKMRHSSAQVDRDYDTLLMGHWHQDLWLPRAIVNNTLKGSDEYSRLFLRAPSTPPSQSLWFTHPKHGITARWGVRLDDAPSNPSGDWVSVKVG